MLTFPSPFVIRKDDGGDGPADGPSQTSVHVDSILDATHSFRPGPGGKCRVCGKVHGAFSITKSSHFFHATHPYHGGEAEILAKYGVVNSANALFGSIRRGVFKGFNPDEPRDDHGRWTDGGGAAAGGVDPASHAVGVSSDPNSQSLHTLPGPRGPDESESAYNNRLFRQGQERYPAATFVEQAATRYRDSLGLPNPRPGSWNDIEAPLQRQHLLGDAFANAVSNPNDPTVRAAYKDLVNQTMDQWHLLTDPPSRGGLGVKVEFLSPAEITARYGDPEGLNPYPTALAQRDDVVNNHHLAIASIADYPSAYHPLLTNTRGGEYDTFRGVHDAFGHTAVGADFTRHGEFQAWLHHSSMFHGPARMAASTELTGENSFLVTHHRPAVHKAALLPSKLIAMPWDDKGNFRPDFWKFNHNHDEIGRFASSDSAESISQSIQAEVATHEPRITQDLQGIASHVGGQMVGLDFRIKSPESLTRKIATRAATRNTDPATEAAKITDALRYTMVLPADRYVAGVGSAIAQMQKQGYRFSPSDIENNWAPGDAYNGINTLFSALGLHRKVELQFHTPESYAAKEHGTHAAYERFRQMPEGHPERRSLFHQMTATADRVSPWPLGVTALGVPVQRPFTRALTILPLDPFRKYSDDQPRDDHGRWTSGGGGGDSAALPEHKQPSRDPALAGLNKPNSVKSIVKLGIENGGFSWHPATATEPHDGFMVAVQGHSSIIPFTDPSSPTDRRALAQQIVKYIRTNGDLFRSNPEMHLGGWHDKDRREFVLDPSLHVKDRSTAIRLGRRGNQQAIWDVANMKEISTGGTGDRELAKQLGAGIFERAAARARDTAGGRDGRRVAVLGGATGGRGSGGLGLRPIPLAVTGFDLSGEAGGQRSGTAAAPSLAVVHLLPVAKFNPNHDELGRFSSGSGGGGAPADSASVRQALGSWSESAISFRMAAAKVLGVNAPGYRDNPDGRGSYVDPPVVPMAANLLRAVRDAPPLDEPLYRGLSFPGAGFRPDSIPGRNWSDLAATLKPGKMIDMPLAGFSSSPVQAGSFAMHLMMKVAPGAKGISESAGIHTGEHEYISGGRFRIEDVTDSRGARLSGDVTHLLHDQPDRFPLTVTLRQVDVFNPDRTRKALSPDDYQPWPFDFTMDQVWPISKRPTVAKSSVRLLPITKFNHNHDERGRFASSDDGGATPSSTTPVYYHGSRYNFRSGTQLTPGHTSSWGAGQNDGYVYFTSDRNAAAQFAEAGYGPDNNIDAPPRVYEVQPTGSIEVDPNEPAFPSFRSKAPLNVVRTSLHKSSVPLLPLFKYSDSEPRVPKGGEGGGEWTDGGGAAAGSTGNIPVHHPLSAELISPHNAKPDPSRGTSGRGTPLPDNAHATELSALPTDVQAQLTKSVLDNSPNHDLTPDKIVGNLEALYKDAEANNPAAIAAGKTWYNEAQTAALTYGRKYGFEDRAAIGMTAALSPQNEWGQNIAGAGFMMKTIHENPAITLTPPERDYLATKAKGKSAEGTELMNLPDGTHFNDLTPKQAAWATIVLGKRAELRSDISTPKGVFPKVAWSTGTNNIARAIEIARGADPADALGGHKVRSFFNNLTDPNNEAKRGDVTMDTHAISAATGVRMAATSKVLGKMFGDSPSIRSQNIKGSYPVFADAFRTVAARHGMNPNQMQAALWLHWQQVRYRYPDEHGAGPSAWTVGRFGIQGGSGKGSSRRRGTKR